jgi:putative FmdB family regulatory protein
MVFWFGDSMPIYEYRCSKCGFQQDVLQRLNEAPLTKCPECGKRTFKKQVTAAGFQLKGTGWYATDFKNSGGAKKPGDKPAEASGKDASGKDSAAKESSAKESTTKESKSESGSAASAAGS